MMETIIGTRYFTVIQERTTEKHGWEGKQLGKYKILRLLGSGAMGSVYQAYNNLLRKTVCLKVLPPTLVYQDKSALQRFIEEARAVAKLDHPNIVQVTDIDEENGVYFIVMEYIEGKTLTQLIAQKDAFTIKNVLQIGAQIARALESAHKEGIVHCDVKPANIMITDNQQAKLTDFGIARTMDNKGITNYGRIMGTPYYMAPEYFTTDCVDQRMDIYSLGVTLFHLLSGHPPYCGKSPRDTIDQHLHTPVPSIKEQRSDVPSELEAILKKAMAKNLKDRFTTAGKMAWALEECIDRLVDYRTQETRRIPEAIVSRLKKKYDAPAQKEKIRVLVVESSYTMCKAICRILKNTRNIEVAGFAHDGSKAIKLILELKPDVVTLNYNLPDINGAAAVREIMGKKNIPVLMLSSYTSEGMHNILECLSCGAVDFIWKATHSEQERFKEELTQKLRGAARMKLKRTKSTAILNNPGFRGPKELSLKPAEWVTVMGAGAGGFSSCLKLFPRIPQSISSAIILVQEMPNEQVKAFANYLNHHSKIVVKEIASGEPLIKGVCYLTNHLSQIYIENCPNSGNLQIVKKQKDDSEMSSFRQALFSVANECGRRAIGVVLTGSNQDAIKGLKQVKALGGSVIAQSPETCIDPQTAILSIGQKFTDEVTADADIGPVLWHILQRKSGYSATTKKMRSMSRNDNIIAVLSNSLHVTNLQKKLSNYKLLQFSSLAKLTEYSELHSTRILIDSDNLGINLIEVLDYLRRKAPKARISILADTFTRSEEPAPIISLAYGGDESKLAHLLPPYLSGFYFKAKQIGLALVLFLAQKGRWNTVLYINRGTPDQGRITLRRGQAIEVYHRRLSGAQALQFLMQNADTWDVVETKREDYSC